MWEGMGGSGWMGGGWLGMVVFLVLIILVVTALVKWLSDRNPGSGSEETPLQVLKKRYARGEIDEKEFERKKRDLES